MILEESTLQRSVTKMDVVHLLVARLHLKCYIMEDAFPFSNTDTKMRERESAGDLCRRLNCSILASNNP